MLVRLLDWMCFSILAIKFLTSLMLVKNALTSFFLYTFPLSNCSLLRPLQYSCTLSGHFASIYALPMQQHTFPCLSLTMLLWHSSNAPIALPRQFLAAEPSVN
ncbi:hypothetical protein FGO68_gene17100 [Halteria grandinella]|uniref:Uncharacterized protein n=1 Tax=Halteria grandinella TaxID=5974 RepID=A0A8J8NF83_HALGN|nr:hypothetical protein FGO68_gene17100 [Halteria grandinella]